MTIISKILILMASVLWVRETLISTSGLSMILSSFAAAAFIYLAIFLFTLNEDKFDKAT